MTDQFVLAIGDFHIPNRAYDIPVSFKEYLVSGKITNVLCTGNIGNNDTFNYIKRISNSFYMVRGDIDEMEGLPEYKKVTINGFNILILHGHQVIPFDDDSSLLMLAREYDADIVISGHTHIQSFREVAGVYLINPGSATGAFTTEEV